MKKMDVKEILDLPGEFTWMFGHEFFVETPEGNFIFSDPDYGGRNTLTYCKSDYKEFLDTRPEPFGRSKGKHIIKNFCGTEVQVEGINNE